jgi:large subunit ribosomal protein L21
MASAVFRSGGKQFRVAEGDTVKVEKLEGDPGQQVTFEEVLLISGEKPKIGRPIVSGAKVLGQILEQGRGEKLVAFKFRRRKRYKRKAGHRQPYTAVKITTITG